ncbi:MAG: hypothetical protein ACP5D2_01645 [Candidatus Nanoarchaeia archaeon]
MVTNDEAVVKISRWLLDEVEKFRKKNRKNRTNFPSKRYFVDKAVLYQLEKLKQGRNNG